MLKSPNVTLKAPLASSFGTPMADNTCDGAVSPDEHADPPDAHIPTASNFNSNSPEFILLKHKLQFPGSRCYFAVWKFLSYLIYKIVSEIF